MQRAPRAVLAVARHILHRRTIQPVPFLYGNFETVRQRSQIPVNSLRAAASFSVCLARPQFVADLGNAGAGYVCQRIRARPLFPPQQQCFCFVSVFVVVFDWQVVVNVPIDHVAHCLGPRFFADHINATRQICLDGGSPLFARGLGFEGFTTLRIGPAREYEHARILCRYC